MTIDTSKILTVSARDYVKSRGKILNNYDMHGIQISRQSGNIENFLEKVPDNSEVVVDYTFRMQNISDNTIPKFLYTASGTALIPKRK